MGRVTIELSSEEAWPENPMVTQTASPQAGDSERHTAIDNLRTAMMCVVMFGHPLLPYTTVPRRFQEPQAHVAFDVLGVFLYGFAMPAFFLTAGFAAAALQERRGPRAFWRNRWRRIFLPLLVGYIILTPLTRAAYEFAQVMVATQSLEAGWAVWTRPDWLRWGKAYHLWFLASLLVFSGLAMALRGAVARLPSSVEQGLRGVADTVLLGRRRLLWLSGGVGVLMAQSYVTGTGQGTSLGMQLAVFSFFGLGWLVHARRDRFVLSAAETTRSLCIGLASVPLCAWSTLQRLHADGGTDWGLGILAGFSNALLAVAMTLGLMGLFQRYLQRPGPLGRYLSAASYWIYLIHYPIVITAGGLLALTDWPAMVKYVAVIALSLPLILGSYAGLVQHGPLGHVLGGGRRPQ